MKNISNWQTTVASQPVMIIDTTIIVTWDLDGKIQFVIQIQLNTYLRKLHPVQKMVRKFNITRKLKLIVTTCIQHFGRCLKVDFSAP